MKLVLLGPPGAGKGTQAERISETYALPHISTGDIFRKNLKKKTPLGIKAQEYMDQGLLVPDDLTIEMVLDRIGQDDCRDGYLLDGFPRTLAQAEAFDKVQTLDYVINIEVPAKELVDRLTGRRMCDACGKIYHVSTLNGREDCDCGGKLTVRSDDRIEAVTKRLEVYQEQTFPLVEHYTKLGVIANIDGTVDVDSVFAQIRKVLG